MPDFQDFSVSKNAQGRWQVSGRITNSRTGVTLRDFTGANAKDFLQLFNTLTDDQQQEIVELAVQRMLYMASGLG